MFKTNKILIMLVDICCIDKIILNLISNSLIKFNIYVNIKRVKILINYIISLMLDNLVLH